MSSSEAPVLTSSEALVSSSLVASVPSSTAPPVQSSSMALAPASFIAPVSAIPLPSSGGGDVFAVVVPPARPSFGFAKKKVARCVDSGFILLLLSSFFWFSSVLPFINF